MAWNYYDAGIGNAASYQVSGHPFVTGSTLNAGSQTLVTFPFVTKAITVAQSGSTGKLRVHFVPTSSMAPIARCYFEMNSHEDALTMNIKCKEIYLSNGDAGNATGFQIFAELTRIDTKRMFALTGSGISE